MSLRPIPCRDVPAATAAVARAAFPHGSPYLRLRDHLGTIFSDAQFAPLFAPCGQPAECPWRLALVSLLQFAEGIVRLSADGAEPHRTSRSEAHSKAGHLNPSREGPSTGTAMISGVGVGRTPEEVFHLIMD